MYIGMLIGAWYQKIICFKRNIHYISIMIFALGMTLMCKFICSDGFKLDSMFPFGSGLNPPSISLTLYAITVCFFILHTVKLIEKLHNKLINTLIAAFDYIGKHTLYIFLYHRIFLDLYLCKTDFKIAGLLKVITYFGVMIGGSLIIEFIVKKLVKIVYISYGLLPDAQ